MSTYKRGTEITHYCSYITIEGKEPSTISSPTITIRHVDESLTLITDVNEAVLLLAAENVYFYKWDIPAGAYIGNYNIECSAVLDGSYAESNETIRVEA